ncbi:MAG: ribonucleotide-diphosphate reductase subunit beta [Lentisphaeria bacterium]|nr:ribonucleotide-diphosphate reductase subunit beta [Lentisphaeria bacterium]
MGSSTNRILNTKKMVADVEKSKIFLGEYSGFQRYDSPKYSFATNIEEHMRNAFWNPNEVSMTKDSQSFFDLPEFIQEVMIRIWLFQTVMDSAQNSGLEEVLASITTNPEFEAMFKTQGYFELIHSLSYSHILRGIFPDSTKIFDQIEDYDEIKHRVDKEIEGYYKVSQLDQIEDETEKKKAILELLIRIFALEGVKFYVSFLVTYVINNNYGNKIQGSTRIIKLINFDEDLHTRVISGTLNILKRNPEEGFADLINSDWYQDKVKEIFVEVFEDEMEWADYLLSFGNIPTLTKKVVSDFMQYYIDFRVVALGCPKIYNRKKSDTVTWFDMYKDIDKDNTAQQEAEATNYSIGILKDDLGEEEYKGSWE